jgi:hypothetical protein
MISKFRRIHREVLLPHRFTSRRTRDAAMLAATAEGALYSSPGCWLGMWVAILL